MRKTITLLGSSSGRNAGDAALMSGIMDSVDLACGTRQHYEIPTIKPSYVRENYRNDVTAISMLPWNLSIKMFGLPTYQSLMRSDLSLVFDAILFDRSLYNPLFNFMSSLALLLPQAKKRGKKMAFFNVGAGPVETPAGRRMLRDIAEMMDFITVRDRDSFDILKDIGVQNPRVMLTADAALNVVPSDADQVRAAYKRLGLNPADDLLAININQYIDTWAGLNRPSMGKEKFLSVYAAALNSVASKLRVPMMFVCTQHHDVSITKELMSRVKSSEKKVIFTNQDHNHYEVKGVLSQASLLFAMRLHAMILASSELCPIAGLAYQPKCSYYFKSLGLEKHILSFENFSETTLTDFLLDSWQKRDEIRTTLKNRIPILKNEAHKAGQLAASILKDEDLDRTIASLNTKNLRLSQNG